MNDKKQVPFFNEFYKKMQNKSASFVAAIFKNGSNDTLDTVQNTNNSELSQKPIYLKDTKLSPKAIRSLNNAHISDLNNLYNADISQLIDFNIYDKIIDEIIDELISYNIPFIGRNDAYTRLKDIELSHNTKNALYKRGVFYKEYLQDIDLNIFSNSQTCQSSALDEIIDFLNQNDINYKQKKSNGTLLKSHNVSPPMEIALYRLGLYYSEDLSNFDLTLLSKMQNIGPSTISEIIEFLENNNIPYVQKKEDAKFLKNENLSYETLNFLYKNHYYTFEDFDDFKITDIASMDGIRPKIIDSLFDYLFAVNHKNFRDFQNRVRITDLNISSNIKSALYKAGVYFVGDNIDINKVIELNPTIADKTKEDIKQMIDNNSEIYSNIISDEMTINNEDLVLIDDSSNPEDVIKDTDIQENYTAIANNEDDSNKNTELLNDDYSILQTAKISDALLSVRTTNLLKRLSIKTIWDLIHYPKDKLYSASGFGQNCHDEIEVFLKQYNVEIPPYKSGYSLKKIRKNIDLSIPDDTVFQRRKKVSQQYNNNDKLMDNTNLLKCIKDLSCDTCIKEIFYNLNVYKIGQLIEYDIEKLVLGDDELTIQDNINELSVKYSDLVSELFELDITEWPVKFTFEWQKFYSYTINEILDIGLQNTLLSIIKKMYSILKDREKDVLYKRWASQRTLEDVGDEYQLTRERVRQIQKKATKKVQSCHMENVLNNFSNCLFNEFGPLYAYKEDSSIEFIKNTIDELNRVSTVPIALYFNTEYKILTKDSNWQSLFLEKVFDIVNSYATYIVSEEKLKDIIRQALSTILLSNTSEQIENFDKIFEILSADFIQKYTIKVETNDYKILAKNKLNKSGKVSTAGRNEEIIAAFKNIYPNGVHLPIEKNKENILKENLKPLIDTMPYKLSIRTLSDGVIKSSEKVILWNKGTYIHIDNINIKWSIVDDVIGYIISEFENGYSHFSVKKIFETKKSIMNEAGIPTHDALMGLIKFKNNPRIGNKKFELFDLYSTGDNITKTDIIETFLKERDGWVSVEDMYSHFCDELGWEEYQVEQYVGNSKLAKKDTNMGFIHLNVLNKYLNKDALRDLLELLIHQLNATSCIKLSDVKKNLFKKKWKDVLSYDVTGNFMADYIDTLPFKSLPIIFYRGYAYNINYSSLDLVAKYNANDIHENYNNKNLDKVYYEFRSFDNNTLLKIINSDIKIANVFSDKTFDEISDYFYKQDFQNLGILLFFPFNCIEIKKMFPPSTLKKTVDKICSWLESHKTTQKENETLNPMDFLFRS